MPLPNSGARTAQPRPHTARSCASRVRSLVLTLTAVLGTTSAHACAIGDQATPQWRPAVHYTPRCNWMNDPNGLVYDAGVFHLFYQYNPYGSAWGNMSWGHATSSDLLHWREAPIAMRADDRQQVFSGSIVADALDSSGLRPSTATNAPLVALYTSAYNAGSGHAPSTQAQSLAFSTDHGKTWTQYAHNPVLTLNPESRQFRDPKVSWYAAGGYWVMATVVADAQVVKFYRSSNLIDWTFLSDFTLPGIPHSGALWEMPDLIPFELDGDRSQVRWVLIVNVNPWSIAGGSGAMYFVGRFDGATFTPDRVLRPDADPAQYDWLDHGADYYAAGTFSGAPGDKAVAIGWMSNWDYADRVPTAPWKGAMALPRELALKTIDGRPQLTSIPARQFRSFVAQQPGTRVTGLAVTSASQMLPSATRGDVQNIELTMTPGTAQRAGIIVRGSADASVGTRIIYDVAAQTLTLDRSASGETRFSGKFSPVHIVHLPLVDGKLQLNIVVDRSSVEVFAQHGRVAITDLVFPSCSDDRVAVFAQGGTATFDQIEVTNLAQPAPAARNAAPR